MSLDEDWRGHRVLVTGYSGFKGSWLVTMLERLGASVSGFAREPAGRNLVATACRDTWRGSFLTVDVRDGEAVNEAFRALEPRTVFHLAAQSLVLESYDDPIGTFHANVIGTAHVLDAAARCGTVDAVLVVTSDKVYDNDGRDHAYAENAPLGGSDPYSASKACAELVARVWRSPVVAGGRLRVATARAGNVIGGGDRSPQRLLPDIFVALDKGESVSVRYPDFVRPWQHVLDPLHGYLLQAARLLNDPASAPAACNFGPDPADRWTVGRVVERVLAEMGGGTWLSEDGAGRPEARTLTVDSSIAMETLGWRSLLRTEEAITWTCAWERARAAGADITGVTFAQIDEFLARAAA